MSTGFFQFCSLTQLLLLKACFPYDRWEKKSSTIAAIIAIIWKPLSSDRSDNDHWDRTFYISAIAGKWFPYDSYDRWTFFFLVWSSGIASPETSFGVRSSRIHFTHLFPWGRNERVTNEPQRTCAGRLALAPCELCSDNTVSSQKTANRECLHWSKTKPIDTLLES